MCVWKGGFKRAHTTAYIGRQDTSCFSTVLGTPGQLASGCLGNSPISAYLLARNAGIGEIHATTLGFCMSSEDVNSGHQACTLRAVCHPLGLPTPQSPMEKWSHVIVSTTTRGRYNLALPLLLHHWIIQNNELPGNVMSHTEVTERVRIQVHRCRFLISSVSQCFNPRGRRD